MTDVRSVVKPSQFPSPYGHRLIMSCHADVQVFTLAERGISPIG